MHEKSSTAISILSLQTYERSGIEKCYNERKHIHAKRGFKENN